MARAKVIPGGHGRIPNRWYDAGYADAAPGSVTQVYGFLCRWADNETLIVEQSIEAIRRKSGVRADRTVRQAIWTLEKWGVMTRLPAEHQNSINQWQLNELAKRAPVMPKKDAPTSAQSGRVAASGAPASDGVGTANTDDPGTSHMSSTPAQSEGAQSAGAQSAGAESGTPYQTASYQTASNQPAEIIPCSGAEAPTHGAVLRTRADRAPDFVHERASDDDGGNRSMFHEFWRAYPGYDDAEAKRAAMIAWNTVKPDARLAREIVAAVDHQRQWPEWIKDHGDFVPHPARWLLGKRWEDEGRDAPDVGHASDVDAGAPSSESTRDAISVPADPDDVACDCLAVVRKVGAANLNHEFGPADLVGTLAERTGHSPDAVAAAIRDLVRRGLIQRFNEHGRQVAYIPQAQRQPAREILRRWRERKVATDPAQQGATWAAA